MSISSLFQFVIGFIIGIGVLAGGSTVAAYLFITNVDKYPPKPLFTEEKHPENVPSDTTTSEAPAENNGMAIEAIEVTRKEKTPVPQKPLEPGAYRAKVTWPEGLSLRSRPSIDGERIGGIGYNWEIIILKESADKKWQRIRIPSSQQEGWVKAGNVQKI